MKECKKEYISNALFFILIITVFTLGIIKLSFIAIEPYIAIITEIMRYTVITGLGIFVILSWYVLIDNTRDYVRYCKGGK